MVPAATQAHPTVLLLHEQEDGTQHVDWMLAQDPRGRDPLITFRLPCRLDTLAPGNAVEAVRIADHRPAYLEYEGPVSGDRGTVRRVAAGRVLRFSRQGGRWHLDVRWETSTGNSPTQQLRVAAIAGDVWTVEAL